MPSVNLAQQREILTVATSSMNQGFSTGSKNQMFDFYIIYIYFSMLNIPSFVCHSCSFFPSRPPMVPMVPWPRRGWRSSVVLGLLSLCGHLGTTSLAAWSGEEGSAESQRGGDIFGPLDPLAPALFEIYTVYTNKKLAAMKLCDIV